MEIKGMLIIGFSGPHGIVQKFIGGHIFICQNFRIESNACNIDE
jgi:hypothetical protein